MPTCVGALRSTFSPCCYVTVSDDYQSGVRKLKFMHSAACADPDDGWNSWTQAATRLLPAGCSDADACTPALRPLPYESQAFAALALLPPTVLREECRVLVVGGGTGSMADFVARALPRARVDSLEPDMAVIRLSQRFFGLDHAIYTVDPTTHELELVDGSGDAGDRVRVVAVDGSSFLEAADHVVGPYDLIFVDAFSMDNDIDMPRDLATAQFAHALRRASHPAHGVVVVNAFDDDPLQWAFRREVLGAFSTHYVLGGSPHRSAGGGCSGCQEVFATRARNVTLKEAVAAVAELRAAAAAGAGGGLGGLGGFGGIGGGGGGTRAVSNATADGTGDGARPGFRWERDSGRAESLATLLVRSWHDEDRAAELARVEEYFRAGGSTPGRPLGVWSDG